jgi:hypothetical protein
VLGEALESGNGKEFERTLESYVPSSQVFYFDGRFSERTAPEILNSATKAERVVVAAYVAFKGTRQVSVNGKLTISYGLLGPSGQLLEDVLGAAPEKQASSAECV